MLTCPQTESLLVHRSLEYVGPILKMLSNAYEKYNHHPAQSKSVESKTSSATSVETKAE